MRGRGWGNAVVVAIAEYSIALTRCAPPPPPPNHRRHMHHSDARNETLTSRCRRHGWHMRRTMCVFVACRLTYVCVRARVSVGLQASRGRRAAQKRSTRVARVRLACTLPLCSTLTRLARLWGATGSVLAPRRRFNSQQLQLVDAFDPYQRTAMWVPAPSTPVSMHPLVPPRARMARSHASLACLHAPAFVSTRYPEHPRAVFGEHANYQDAEQVCGGDTWACVVPLVPGSPR